MVEFSEEEIESMANCVWGGAASFGMTARSLWVARFSENQKKNMAKTFSDIAVLGADAGRQDAKQERPSGKNEAR